MPMTASQATVQNLVNSVRDWIGVNIVPQYVSAAASTSYAGTPVVSLAEPDDSAQAQGVPRIAIELPTDARRPEPIGIGDGEVWKYKSFYLAVFPGMNLDGIDAGKPSIQSTQLLQTLFDYAMSTALVFPINDWSSGSKGSVIDYAYVEDQRIIKPRGGVVSAAMLRHRFDYTFTLKYAVTTIN